MVGSQSGAGETGQGPAVAAIGSAIADAIGKRPRDLPLSRERIKAAIGTAARRA
jgi:CO/xanthine dehydrogenase Mo-binding subunit